MAKKKHRDAGSRPQRRDQFVNAPTAERPGISWATVILAAGLVFLGVTLYVSLGRSPAAPAFARGNVETLPAGQDVAFPVSLFDDGQARFYRYTTSIGREIQLFVMKSSDGIIRAAFDACDVCYRERRGYRQSGDVMICNNCGRSFRSVDINVLQGGCNPAPIDRSLAGGQVVLKATDLDRGAAYY